ncbi:MAG: EamA/RhaT family transporter [Rikenellaceae bacterium]|nr:EamA/RhaT family transporter [Rikenellaceae bacterium]
MKDSSMGHLACFVAYVIFGVNIIVCKDLTGSHLISPIVLFFLRSIGAGLLFWLLGLFLPHEKVELRDLPKICAASFLGFFLTQMTFLSAISEITPMDCSILSSLSPLYTMFIAAYALKEPITVRKAGGVLMSFLGVTYLIVNTTNASGVVLETKPEGVFLMLLNTISFALYLGFFKPLIAKYSLISFLKWIFLFSTILSLPFAFGELVTIDFMTLPPAILSELAFLIVFSTCIAYFLIPYGQKRIRPTLVSMYSYVQPIIAIVISIWVGMDTLSWQKVLAAVMVFGGVVMVNYSRSARSN